MEGSVLLVEWLVQQDGLLNPSTLAGVLFLLLRLIFWLIFHTRKMLPVANKLGMITLLDSCQYSRCQTVEPSVMKVQINFRSRRNQNNTELKFESQSKSGYQGKLHMRR